MLKAENLILHVEDNGAKKCLLDHISFQVDDGEMLVIKRRWKVHTGEGPDRNREGGERKDLFKRGRYHGF